MKYHILSYILIIFCSSAFSKEARKDSLNTSKNNYWFSEVKYAAGYVTPSTNFLKGKNRNGKPINFYHSGTILFGKRTYGLKEWEELYNYPSYGVALYTASFLNGGEELGIPSAVYGFFRAPIKRYKKVNLNYDIGVGVSFNWKPYDPVYNPFNLTIGSYSTLFFEFGIHLEIPLSERLYLMPGICFNHFSNGSLKKPNEGINMIAPSISLHYDFNPELPEFIKHDHSSPQPDHELLFFIGAGAKQLELPPGINAITPWYNEVFFAASLTTGWQKRLNRRTKAGLGVDFAYDESFASEIVLDEDRNPHKKHGDFKDGISIGIFGSGELELDRVSVSFALGYYLLRGKGNEDDGNFFQMLGIKYYLLKNSFLGINFRLTDFSNADYISWMVGHRIVWDRKNKHRN